MAQCALIDYLPKDILVKEKKFDKEGFQNFESVNFINP
jgi:hypothetical protein